MKRITSIIALVGLMLFLCLGAANASTVKLTWDAVDFASVGSDPDLSGYRLYKSLDDGASKMLLGSVASTKLEYQYTEPLTKRICYYATAFNQVGESAYSITACAYISDKAPTAPTNLKAFLIQLISFLQGLVAGMEG